MLILDATRGATLSAFDTMYPSALEVVEGDHEREAIACTTYGYVLSGVSSLSVKGARAELAEGAYFAVPGAVSLSGSARVALITRIGFLGLFQVGTLEAAGRLAYIDGCSDTILVMPPRLGDPVLNHLHFPVNIDQTLHAHPSIRLGVVVRGEGLAHGPGWERALTKGCVFLLDAHERHAFRTGAASMDVVAFHPDSDWGPTDALHPMKNRTYLRLAGATRRVPRASGKLKNLDPLSQNVFLASAQAPLRGAP